MLLLLIAGGNREALSVLYDRCGRLVYSMVYRIVGNAPDTDEVTQDVFLRIWERANRFDPKKGTALAWIMAITRRLAIDRTRSKAYADRQREVHVPSDTEMAQRPSNTPDPSEMMIGFEEVQKMRRALDRLDQDHRAVIDLAYYDGLTHAQIAERTNLPLGTVKTRLRKAVHVLREMFNV